MFVLEGDCALALPVPGLCPSVLGALVADEPDAAEPELPADAALELEVETALDELEPSATPP